MPGAGDAPIVVPVSDSPPTGPDHDNQDPVSIGGVVVACLAVSFVMFAVALAAWYAGESHSSAATAAPPASTTYPAVSPQVAAGAHDFSRFACAQCHGFQGQGGVSADVPALAQIGPTLTEATLEQVIAHGAGVSSNPTKPFMPVWNGIISTTQIHELAAYLHAGLPAVKDSTPPAVPAGQGDAVAGSVLYVKFGCLNCHGPNGLGGVPNPDSPDTTIPSLATADFRHEFNTAQKIRDVIVSGSVIGRAPIVSMPHWGGILTPTEIRQLIAYLQTLK
jgi:mono/diheme cytochrome c family protein